MDTWEKEFDSMALDKGKNAFLNHRVVDLKEENGNYSAAVLVRERYEVSLKMLPSGAKRLNCRCLLAKMGRKCEHMAALMYAVYMPELLERKENKEREERERIAREEKVRAVLEEKVRTAHRAKQRIECEEKERTEREEKERIEREEKERIEREERERIAIEMEWRQRLNEGEVEERERRKRQREERKAEMARKKEEQKQLALEAKKREDAQRIAEQERRERIRQEKAEAAKRKAEKREQEKEASRIAAEKKLQEEKRLEEERKKAEEARKKEETLRQLEEARRNAEEQRKRMLQAMDQENRRNEYEALGTSEAWEETEQHVEEKLEALANYRYFDGTVLRTMIQIPDDVIEDGKTLVRKGKVYLEAVRVGFDGAKSNKQVQIVAKGREGRREFGITLGFSKNEIKYFRCECPSCIRSYFGWYRQDQTDCKYKAAVLLLTEKYLAENSIGDATDAEGEEIIRAYRQKRANLVMANEASGSMDLKLVPRLTRKNGELSISFKVGESKLFVVKKLDVFCDNVRASATEVYGSSTEINHSEENFSSEGKVWIRFISQVVREEREFQMRLIESRSYYGNIRESVGSQLELFGWRLDEFSRLLGKEGIEFEDKDSSEKKKCTLFLRDQNPRAKINITEDTVKGDPQFHGIQVKGSFPDLYYGTDHVYYIGSGYLNRAERSFMDLAGPLANLVEKDHFSFRVGINRISEFYNRVLPELQKIADVKESKPEKFRSWLMPEARFTFYLDLRDGDAVCRIFAWYGDREVNVLDRLMTEQTGAPEPFRDLAGEEEILYHAMQWFPELLRETGELSLSASEDRLYELMKQGTEKLMELGEVKCTKRFLGQHKVRHVRVSVGVSVASDLLELSVTTENVPREELLELLKQYRKKQKYFRLKDGSFIDLEEHSLETLSELMEAMQIKPGEMAKGSMKLPMYRTLYLDKLLEENEEIYCNRDLHFREMVKSFKTVRDADFEEPASLSGTMRNYQKDGYRWLRTLESWHFGGILADEMGLGKTLQMIAVLLAAKEEGKKGRSLVVTPASLVFNWGEEFHRFAPALKVVLVSGTLEERQRTLAESEDADVLVTSYDLLKRDIALYEKKQFLYEIIDEAQYIKNQTTAAAKAVKVIHSQIRFALTGTPIENRLSELWSIFDYLMPGFLYGSDVFRKEIELPVVKNGDEQAMQRLQKMVSPFILRRKKEDVLKDLPEKLEEYRYVQLSGEQQKLYDGQVLFLKERLNGQNEEEYNRSKIQILAELMRLRQICCDPSLCFEGYQGETAKLEACLELIQSAMDGGHRMLVFSQFTSMLDIIMRELDKLEIPYYTITGGTSKEKRIELVKQFNEGSVPVFLISLKAGGVGLNLTGADMVIHYDPWWNVAAQNQATDRAHRIGQKKKVTVYKLIARHTIEEKIQKLQETKQDLAEQIMGQELGGLGSLSQEELLELLQV